MREEQTAVRAHDGHDDRRVGPREVLGAVLGALAHPSAVHDGGRGTAAGTARVRLVPVGNGGPFQQDRSLNQVETGARLPEPGPMGVLRQKGRALARRFRHDRCDGLDRFGQDDEDHVGTRGRPRRRAFRGEPAQVDHEAAEPLRREVARGDEREAVTAVRGTALGEEDGDRAGEAEDRGQEGGVGPLGGPAVQHGVLHPQEPFGEVPRGRAPAVERRERGAGGHRGHG